mmetsp:Transcript_6467/g.20959  ORF Transcript_6467/g.20959 Transcript_6467/m.20959 type:complete len:283 (+) Transcript_6467:1122-1970(+)
MMFQLRSKDSTDVPVGVKEQAVVCCVGGSATLLATLCLRLQLKEATRHHRLLHKVPRERDNHHLGQQRLSATTRNLEQPCHKRRQCLGKHDKDDAAPLVPRHVIVVRVKVVAELCPVSLNGPLYLLVARRVKGDPVPQLGGRRMRKARRSISTKDCLPRRVRVWKRVVLGAGERERVRRRKRGGEGVPASRGSRPVHIRPRVEPTHRPVRQLNPLLLPEVPHHTLKRQVGHLRQAEARRVHRANRIVVPKGKAPPCIAVGLARRTRRHKEDGSTHGDEATNA